ncbi:hypothetical protein N665_0432s0014 [Sinapis alba]|nr:hypothetical protein N665_0432s0014 [Sinapis alba]
MLRRPDHKCGILVTIAATILLSVFPPITKSTVEKQALFRFKKHLNDLHDVLRSWKPTDSPCTFHGVTCDPLSGEVIGISLENSNLSGSISPAISSLTKLSTFSSSSNVFASANSVVKFNGLNYGEWFEQIRFTLGVMALDSAILTDEEPSAITVDSSESEKSRYERWERSNRLSLNLMRLTMAESIKPSMPKTEKAREFIEKIKECSQSELADKSIVGSLMNELTTKKFDWSRPIHDHVTLMSNLAAK